MVKFESTSFGEIIIDGKSYGDVLVIGGKVIPRRRTFLKRVYGTSHVIGKEEAEELLKGNPEVVIVGTGQSGLLEVSKEIRREIGQKAKLTILRTPEAIREFNQISHDKKVNALIHTTC